MLVSAPRRAERLWLVDNTISSIDGDLAGSVCISNWSHCKPVVPSNLNNGIGTAEEVATVTNKFGSLTT